MFTVYLVPLWYTILCVTPTLPEGVVAVYVCKRRPYLRLHKMRPTSHEQEAKELTSTTGKKIRRREKAPRKQEGKGKKSRRQAVENGVVHVGALREQRGADVFVCVFFTFMMSFSFYPSCPCSFLVLK